MVLAMVAAGLIASVEGYYVMTQASTSPGSASGGSASFYVSDLKLVVPHSHPPCSGLLNACATDALITATVSVDASSPLSCIDAYLDGASQGSTCWNLTSAGFTHVGCSGSGSQTTCTTTVSANTNNETTRTVGLSQQAFNGTDGSPLIFAGRPYQVTLVGVFQDGTNATSSFTVMATVSENYAVSTASATTCYTGQGADGIATCTAQA